jgi:long-chain fatty acid transport protein
MRTPIRAALIAGVAGAALTSAVNGAQAGGFAIHEQSAYYQGMSFAGQTAGGGVSISSMFWNPATMSQSKERFSSESVYSGIIADTQITPTTAVSSTGANLVGLGPSGDIGQDAIVPASYFIYKFSDRFNVGVAINSPFGLVTSPPNNVWSGMFYSRDSRVRSFNATPMASYQVNEWLAVGAGLQIQYFKVFLESRAPVPSVIPSPVDSLFLRGSSTDIGWTAGITLTPTPWTTIGLGFRSAISQSLQGDGFRPAFGPVPLPLGPGGALVPVVVPAATPAIATTVTLPESASIAIRQRITEQFTLLGTVEWTNWSRLSSSDITVPPAGSVIAFPTQLNFGWRDGWFASVGAEYQWNPQFTLRGGVAFEQSPVTDTTRTTRLPDNDRIWASVGFTYNWSHRLSIDFGYSHIFVDNTAINLVPGNPSWTAAQGTFIGTADSSVDILSIGIRYKFFEPAPLITKG